MFLPGIASGKPANPKNPRSDSRTVVQLGDFESGLDGWRTNGGNKLSTINEDDVPTGVVSGRRGLAVEVNGDLFPMIENKKRVREADFLDHPYLQINVLGYAEETDSDFVFQFRLHHTEAEGQGKKKGKKSGGSAGSKDVNVEESDLIEVPQLRPRKVQWDTSDLPKAVLETSNRLEIIWYLQDHEPERGHRGRAKGDFDYQGLVVFDDIRLSETAPVKAAHRPLRKKLDLHRAHGQVVDRRFDEKADAFERGTLVYADGTTVEYAFELLGGGRFEYTIDGETFRFGGDSE